MAGHGYIATAVNRLTIPPVNLRSAIHMMACHLLYLPLGVRLRFQPEEQSVSASSSDEVRGPNVQTKMFFLSPAWMAWNLVASFLLGSRMHRR